MEVLTERLSKGTLQHLQSLEQQAHELSHGGESRVKQERMLRALQKAVHQLQERRDLLKIQIANSPNKVLVPVLKETQGSGEDSLKEAVKDVIQTSADKKALREAVAEASRLKDKELSVSYRLTGCTVHKSDDNAIRIRWDTFDSGEYFEPYYAVVKHQRDNSLQLVKHSLPYFLPVKDLVAEHLNSDLQGFVRVVGDHLNGFVSRRQQVAEATAKGKRYIKGEIYSSNACNTINLTLTKPGIKTNSLDMQLLYDDMEASRPTRVVVQSSGAISRAENGAIRDVFKTRRIADAIAELFNR